MRAERGQVDVVGLVPLADVGRDLGLRRRTATAILDEAVLLGQLKIHASILPAAGYADAVGRRVPAASALRSVRRRAAARSGRYLLRARKARTSS